MITEKLGTGPGRSPGLGAGAMVGRMAPTIVMRSRPRASQRFVRRGPRYLVGVERREDGSGRQSRGFPLLGVAEGPPPTPGGGHPESEAPSLRSPGRRGDPLPPAGLRSRRL